MSFPVLFVFQKPADEAEAQHQEVQTSDAMPTRLQQAPAVNAGGVAGPRLPQHDQDHQGLKQLSSLPSCHDSIATPIPRIMI